MVAPTTGRESLQRPHTSNQYRNGGTGLGVSAQSPVAGLSAVTPPPWSAATGSTDGASSGGQLRVCLDNPTSTGNTQCAWAVEETPGGARYKYFSVYFLGIGGRGHRSNGDGSSGRHPSRQRSDCNFPEASVGVPWGSCRPCMALGPSWEWLSHSRVLFHFYLLFTML